MNKRLLLLTIALGILILLIPTERVPHAVAQAPSPTPVPSLVDPVDDPNRAVPLDNLPHIIPARAATWFTFYYNATDLDSKPQYVLRLLNGVATLVRFEVWSKERMQSPWWENKPVGRGTQENLVACAPPDNNSLTPVPFNMPHFATNDLTWAGSFVQYDDYYVRVVNDNDTPKEFQMLLNDKTFARCK
jgi:hypothetical protein